jgi:hypothetical protein
MLKEEALLELRKIGGVIFGVMGRNHLLPIFEFTILIGMIHIHIFPARIKEYTRILLMMSMYNFERFERWQSFSLIPSNVVQQLDYEMK